MSHTSTIQPDDEDDEPDYYEYVRENEADFRRLVEEDDELGPAYEAMLEHIIDDETGDQS